MVGASLVISFLPLSRAWNLEYLEYLGYLEDVGHLGYLGYLRIPYLGGARTFFQLPRGR